MDGYVRTLTHLATAVLILMGWAQPGPPPPGLSAEWISDDIGHILNGHLGRPREHFHIAL